MITTSSIVAGLLVLHQASQNPQGPPHSLVDPWCLSAASSVTRTVRTTITSLYSKETPPSSIRKPQAAHHSHNRMHSSPTSTPKASRIYTAETGDPLAAGFAGSSCSLRAPRCPSRSSSSLRKTNVGKARETQTIPTPEQQQTEQSRARCGAAATDTRHVFAENLQSSIAIR